MFTAHPETLTILVRHRHQHLAREAHQTRLRREVSRRRRKT